MAKLTLIDLAKRSGNDKTIGVVEAMSQANAFWSMVPVRESNQAMFKYQQRVSLPTVGFRALNAGVTPDKSVIRDAVVECKDMLGVSEVDKSIADRAPEGMKAYIAKENAGFVAAGANAFNSKAYYGNSATTGAEIDGVGTVLSTLAGTCIGAGGSTSNAETSMYFWSFQDAVDVRGRLPGVDVPYYDGLPKMTELGLQMVYQTGSTTAKYPAYTSIFEFKPAFAVYDSRSVGRLANIDSTHLPTVALINQVITAMFPYQCDLITCSKTVFNYVQGLKGTSAFQQTAPYESDEIFKRATYFNGTPIMIDESITATEAVLS
jgi:hypothetical protein